ncbi:DUF2512 family protein [Gracilibacillus xinjiangensis]|uniref:DUF2512 family protein n=1 Tax=Gracilibacillus xinjiangensis TaxID=1193282 RepID=A0ABV8WV49_9BACI
MNYLKAFGLKFLVSSIVLLSTFTVFYDANIMKVIVSILVITVVSFIVGDILILRKVSNTIATILDLTLHFILVWMLVELLFYAGTSEILPVSVLTAVLITALEPFVHRLLEHSELENVTTLSHERFQAEISEELMKRDEDN